MLFKLKRIWGHDRDSPKTGFDNWDCYSVLQHEKSPHLVGVRFAVSLSIFHCVPVHGSVSLMTPFFQCFVTQVANSHFNNSFCIVDILRRLRDDSKQCVTWTEQRVEKWVSFHHGMDALFNIWGGVYGHLFIYFIVVIILWLLWIETGIFSVAPFVWVFRLLNWRKID